MSYRVDTFGDGGKLISSETRPLNSVEVPGEWELDWKVHLPPESDTGASKAAQITKPPSHPKKKQGGQQQATLDDVDHPQFDEDDKWPRRLLDVNTMISHQWQPGNTYGSVVEPRYSVLSYTWGRWRIRDPQSTVKSLDVKGIPWTIPQVETRHFTVEEFKTVLQLIVEASQKRFRLLHQASTFVWLDVACISQFEPSSIANSEVGRQAKIFRNADFGYVWLTTQTPKDVEILFDINGVDLSPEDAVRFFSGFCKILDDPWFDSMWTLQESYLQHGANFVTNTGLCHHDPFKLKPAGLFQLRNLADGFLLQHERRGGFGSHTEPNFKEFKRTWAQKGLQDPRSNSPLQILASSQFRTSEDELDRVYGIMQIFGDEFQVGKARSVAKGGKPVGQKFTLLELQDELGGLIIHRSAMASQLFCHREPSLAGRAWRICGRASVPETYSHASQQFETMAQNLSAAGAASAAGASGNMSPTRNLEMTITKQSLLQADCAMRLVPSQQSLPWAMFEGRVCRFDRLIHSSKSKHFLPSSSWCDIYLDPGPDFTNVDTKNVESLFKQFSEDVLMVLSLTPKIEEESRHKICRFSGLLLLKPGDAALAHHKTRRDWQSSFDNVGRQAWARVGTCQLVWDDPGTDESDTRRHEVKTIWGTSDEWKVEKGIWG